MPERHRKQHAPRKRAHIEKRSSIPTPDRVIADGHATIRIGKAG